VIYFDVFNFFGTRLRNIDRIDIYRKPYASQALPMVFHLGI